MKQAVLFLVVFLGGFALHAQVPSNGVTIDPDAPDHVDEDIISTTVKIEGGAFDTAVFDSTVKVPFKIHEWRGEEMIHNWITVGCPRAPHIYLGAGIYRFDRFGLSDVQAGAYPLVPGTWEMYFSASQMFFLKKKSKMMSTGICIDEDYTTGKKRHLQYMPELRRDKFYGITVGFAYEGMPNLKNKTVYLYRIDVGGGEMHDIIAEEFKQVSVSAGLSRMRCRNVEYEAPFRRKGRLHASSMSRLTLGAAYFPVHDVRVLMDPGFTVDYLVRAAQPDFTAFIAWEGRTAFLGMKRECGLHMNFVFSAPTWNRVNDTPVSLVWTWGFYFSLDKKNPRWVARLQ